MRIPVVREMESPAEPADTDTFVVVAPRRDDDEQRPKVREPQPPR